MEGEQQKYNEKEERDGGLVTERAERVIERKKGN